MKLFEEFKLYENLWDDMESLTEAPKAFKDSKFPPDLTPGKVYVLKDNYWICPDTVDHDAGHTIKNYLLDSANEKYVRDTYVKGIKDIKFCNTNSPGDETDNAFFFPKGTRFKFIKDVYINNESLQMFTDGKVAFTLSRGINKYLQ